ncbi:MAG: ComEC/Rec2 family competence protein [Yoonia sp.]
MRALAKIENALLAQRGHLFCWVPVCLGIGIGGYYQLPAEPDALIFIAMLVPIGLLYAASRVVRISFAPLLVAICLIGAGAGIAKFRTDHVAGPVLGFRYYGAIEGRVVNIDRSGSDAVRLTLDQVKLERMSSEKTPARVRVSLHGEDETANFNPADIIMTTGHLSPPSGPAEPGGFDFQRHAWFLKIGGVGYTRNPVVRLEAARPSGFKLWVFSQRIALADAVRKQIDGEAGAFAAAIMTGDRSAMSQKTIGNLRATNLAHLLAISGLHMGLLTGFVFAVIRFGLALIPWIALRIPTKKIAAIFSLLIGAAYLALSGGSVATERAYIMVAVMLVAVLLDRRALTLRAVAMAATIVLIIQPEALVGPGFQMSFAATTALVLVFGQMRRFNTQRLPKWARAVLSVVLSSAVAGFATAPFAAAHFNMFAHYGLIANLLSVPLMGLVVMPAAVLAVCFAPIGGWGAGLWLMEKGLLWILYVADRVANIEGGLGHVIAPHAAVLPVLTLGLLWLSLWQGRARFAGLVVAIFAGVLWMQSTRPAVLIADSGGLIGVMGENGRALSRAKGSGFVAGIWLENDGNPVAQDIAAARGGYDVSGREARVVLGAWKILQVSGKTALSALAGCGGADVLIATVEDQIDRPCQVFDIIALRNTGSLALEVLENGDLKITTASDVAGNRPWNAGKDLAPTGILLTLNSDQE